MASDSTINSAYRDKFVAFRVQSRAVRRGLQAIIRNRQATKFVRLEQMLTRNQIAMIENGTPRIHAIA
jgi:hypothetical protein